MIINDNPQNAAVIANVAGISNFSIKATAKSFQILSSGLYANKIRAIIRELSTNAYDSHVSAGKADVPFDVHLPNALEPWFAVRDYGTGLTHDQVVNIYTTYFESTKTNSDDFVGCLGLGSKSPFSYTENFTVTAILNGRKGIYSAFINDVGVPSIALMYEEPTTEPTGVEVKFGVDNQQDFYKFVAEAQTVYQVFTVQPVVTGNSSFSHLKVDYEVRNIIPGVSSVQNGRHAYAVMGNISYPIQVPNSSQVLGNLEYLLSCPLELRFNIGDLDIQASREGLSYIPETIASIKKKLTEVHNRLYQHLAEEADKITNEWEKANFLYNKARHTIWSRSVDDYVNKHPDCLLKKSYYQLDFKNFGFEIADLQKNYNIVIRNFTHRRGKISTGSPESTYDPTISGYKKLWVIRVGSQVTFVTEDTKTGSFERAKFHFKQNISSDCVWVLSPADSTKPALYEKFLKKIKNPPKVLKASELLEKPKKARTTTTASSSIMRLVSISAVSGYRNKDRFVWEPTELSDTDPNATYYYLPIRGFEMISKVVGGYKNAKDLAADLIDCGIKQLGNIQIYGVRSSSLEAVQALPNWINAEDGIASILSTLNSTIVDSMCRSHIDYKLKALFDNRVVMSGVYKNSPIREAYKTYKASTYTELNTSVYTRLYNNITTTALDMVAIRKQVDQEKEKINAVHARYPLILALPAVGYYTDWANDLANYINMVDKHLEDKDSDAETS